MPPTEGAPQLPPANLAEAVARAIADHLRAHPSSNAKQSLYEIAVAFGDSIASACPDRRSLDQALTFVNFEVSKRARSTFKEILKERQRAATAAAHQKLSAAKEELS